MIQAGTASRASRMASRAQAAVTAPRTGRCPCPPRACAARTPAAPGPGARSSGAGSGPTPAARRARRSPGAAGSTASASSASSCCSRPGWRWPRKNVLARRPGPGGVPARPAGPATAASLAVETMSAASAGWRRLQPLPQRVAGELLGLLARGLGERRPAPGRTPRRPGRRSPPAARASSGGASAPRRPATAARPRAAEPGRGLLGLDPQPHRVQRVDELLPVGRGRSAAGTTARGERRCGPR